MFIKNVFRLLVSLLPSLVFCQENWQFFGQAGLSMPTVVLKNSGSGLDQFSGFGMSVAAGKTKLVAKNFQVSFGLEQLVHSHKSRKDLTQWGSENDGNGGYKRDPELDDFRAVLTAQSQIFGAARLNFGQGSWKPFAEIGLGTGAIFYWARTRIGESGSWQKGDTQTYFSSTFRPAIGLSKTQSDGKGFEILLRSRNFLNGFGNANAGFEDKLFALGIEFGKFF